VILGFLAKDILLSDSVEVTKLSLYKVKRLTVDAQYLQLV